MMYLKYSKWIKPFSILPVFPYSFQSWTLQKELLQFVTYFPDSFVLFLGVSVLVLHLKDHSMRVLHVLFISVFQIRLMKCKFIKTQQKVVSTDFLAIPYIEKFSSD